MRIATKCAAKASTVRAWKSSWKPKCSVGIGVNVNQERSQLPESTRVPVGSLYTIDGIKRERAPLLVSILERLEHNYDAWIERGLNGVYDSLGSRIGYRIEEHEVTVAFAAAALVLLGLAGLLWSRTTARLP